MPQMAPLSWLTLMIYFISMLVLLSMVNYYSFTYNNQSSSTKKFNKMMINWKW